MSQFRRIEIDFEIHKLIEGERKSFSETPNQVLRRLLKLADAAPSLGQVVESGQGHPWSGDGVVLPNGTKVRMRYNKQVHEGSIVNGMWVIGGKTFDSPSGAASAVGLTKRGQRTRLDGWNYWEAQFPGEVNWQRISALRAAARGVNWANIDF